MLYLLVFTLINAAADESGWAYPIRINLGGVDLNIFLMAVLAAFAAAVLRGPTYRAQFPTTRVHPALAPILMLFAVAWLLGMLGLVIHHLDIVKQKEVGIAARDFLIIPLGVLIGYLLTATPRSAGRYFYVLLAAGIAVSVMLLKTFGSHSESLSFGASINVMRTNKFISTYAGIASLAAAYVFLTRSRMLRPSLALGIAMFCLVGQIAPLNRSDWVAYAAGFAGLLLLLPKGQRLRPLLWSIVLVPMVALTMWIAIWAASQATGRDFSATMEKRVLSLLPGYGEGKGAKAWETRLPSIYNDLEAFISHPVIGGGFGIQEKMALETGQKLANFHHNAWTDFLAKAGLVGLAAPIVAIGALFVISRRMVTDQFDEASVTVGAVGVITAIMITVLGITTMSFNTLRGSLPLAVTLGVVLRCREMQLLAREAHFARSDDRDVYPAEFIPSGA